MSGQTYREMALAEMAQSNTFFGQPGMERARRLALLPESEEEAASECSLAPPPPFRAHGDMFGLQKARQLALLLRNSTKEALS